MSNPTGESAFLHELEINVRAELTEVETSRPVDEAINVPIDEWLLDPADAERDEAGLRSLLGAVEAMEDGFRPGDEPAADPDT
jgi:hypothetical protein